MVRAGGQDPQCQTGEILERVESSKEEEEQEEEEEEEEEVMRRSCPAYQRRFSRQLRMFPLVCTVEWVLGTVQCTESVTQSQYQYPPPRYRQLYVDTNINTYISPASQIFYGRDNVLPVCWQYANVIVFVLLV